MLCVGLLATSALADTPITYVVQPGDTLWDLAGQFGVSVDELVAMNALSDPSALVVGEELMIKATGPAAPSDVASPASVAVPELTGEIVTDVALVSAAEAVDALAPAASAPSQVVAIPDPGLADKIAAIAQVAPAAPAPPPMVAAPYLSQFDGTIWGSGNCGPTSLAMALGALQVNADPMWLRHLADNQMGLRNPDSGTTWESLAYAARQSGASTDGLYAGNAYRQWSFDTLKAELAQGRPVLLLVRYWNLPDHGDSSFGGDHYIVALGFDPDGNVVYNDPASYNGAGRVITPRQLNKAWTNTWVGLARTAMALYR